MTTLANVKNADKTATIEAKDFMVKGSESPVVVSAYSEADRATNKKDITDNEKITLYPTGLKIDKNIEKNEVSEKDIDNRLRSMKLGTDQLLSKIDLSTLGYLPPAKLQAANSCVGWAVGYYLRTFQQAKDLRWKVGDNKEHIFSPNFIYNQINEGIDEGSYLSDAGKLLWIGYNKLDRKHFRY